MGFDPRQRRADTAHEPKHAVGVWFCFGCGEEFGTKAPEWPWVCQCTTRNSLPQLVVEAMS